MVADETIGVSSANGRHVAGIRAPVVDASGRIGAVEVGEAVPWLFATRLERISDQSVGTNAGVRAFRVLTTGNETIFPSSSRFSKKFKRNVLNGDHRLTPRKSDKGFPNTRQRPRRYRSPARNRDNICIFQRGRTLCSFRIRNSFGCKGLGQINFKS